MTDKPGVPELSYLLSSLTSNLYLCNRTYTEGKVFGYIWDENEVFEVPAMANTDGRAFPFQKMKLDTPAFHKNEVSME